MIKLTNSNLAQIANKITDFLKVNELVVFPSDTVLGVMAAVTFQSISRLNEFKNRQEGKNYALIFDSVASIEKTMILNNHNIRFIKDRTPDYFTFIIKPKQLLDPQIKLVESTDGTIGIRIPKSDLMCEVAKSYGPYIATSANLSGENSVHMVKELEAQMGENLQKAKLIIDGDCSSSRESSTVLDLTHEPAIVIRQGSGVL